MKDVFLSHADAALLNRNNVLNYIRTKGPVSRTDIWEAMDMSRASVTQVIRQLLEAGLVVETGASLSSGGRMLKGLTINGDARRLFVFDWNSHLICLVNIGGEILRSQRLEFPVNCTPAAFAGIVEAGLERIAGAEDGVPSLGLGLALPGLIDARSHTVLYSVELGWRDVSIRRLFAHRFGENVFLERTGNMLAMGEYAFGAARSANHFVLVLLSREGIGASTIIRGDCQHGGNYMYGELGHVKMPVNIMCSCGQVGCLEAVVRDLLMKNGGVMDDEVMEYIAIGISTAVNLCDPEIVMLAGELVQGLSPATNERLAQVIRSKITNERSRRLAIKVSRVDDLMGVKGVSAHVFNQWFRVS